MHNFKTIPHVGFWIPSVLEALEKRLPWTKKAYRPSARVHGRMPWRRSINLTALHRTKPKLEFEPQDAKVEKEKQNHISDYPLLATSCSGIKTEGFFDFQHPHHTCSVMLHVPHYRHQLRWQWHAPQARRGPLHPERGTHWTRVGDGRRRFQSHPVCPNDISVKGSIEREGGWCQNSSHNSLNVSWLKKWHQKSTGSNGQWISELQTSHGWLSRSSEWRAEPWSEWPYFWAFGSRYTPLWKTMDGSAQPVTVLTLSSNLYAWKDHIYSWISRATPGRKKTLIAKASRHSM